MSDAFKIVDKNILHLASELNESNKRIADLEKQLVELTERVNWLYDEPLP